MTKVEMSKDPCDHIALAMSLAKRALAKFDRYASVMDHDIFGEAMLGLVEAARTFEEDKQSFATWAHYKMRGRIGNYTEKENCYRKRKKRLCFRVNDGDLDDGDVKVAIKPEYVCRDETMNDDLLEVLNALEDIGGRESEIIKDRLSGLTLQEIGDKHRLTRERVRQLEERGIEMVRNRVLKSRGAVWL